jgi:hypothetical protein
MSHFYDHVDLPLSFDASAAANLRVKEGGATGEKLLRTYMDGYEKFWQTPRTHGDRAMSMADVQAMIDAAPVVMNQMMADGTAFVAFVQTSHASKVGTDFFPTRYLTIPYEVDVDGRLVSLKPEWDVQEEV